MRNWLRVAAPLIALAALVAAPAHAEGSDINVVSFVAGWDTGQLTGAGAGMPGTWIPYTVQLQNAGSHDFDGFLRLDPHRTGIGPGFGAFGPQATTYEEAVTLPRGATRSYTVFGQYADFQFAQGWGYAAVILDSGRNEVAHSSPAAPSSGALVGTLSDSPAIPKLIADAGRQSTGARVHPFDAQSFPRDPLQLSAFAAIVVDHFDLSLLSQVQMQALQDYVGFGGSLVATGGSSWRRTLAQLPSPLVVFRPDSTNAVALSAVSDLLGKSNQAVVPGASGTPSPGALLVLADAAGHPLMVSGQYGAGHLTALTFDPADDADQAYPDVAAAAWAQAIDRSLGQGTVNGGVFLGGGKAITPISGMPRNSIDSEVTSLINDTPANALPPVALLGGLLMLYILVAGPLNYAVLRGLRRRELMWVSVPLVAVVFTGVAYTTGFVTHGSQFYVNEVELFRLAPDGSADATSFDAVFAPHRGDLSLQLPAGTYAATTPDQQISASGANNVTVSDKVVTGRGAHVLLSDVAVWSERAVKTESSQRTTLQLEAHLAVGRQSVKGTVTNHSRTAIRDLALALPAGKWASLTSVVGPGETVSVSVPVQSRPYFTGTGGCYSNGAGVVRCTGGGTGVSCPPNVSSCVNVQGDGPAARSLSDTKHQRSTVLAATALLPNDGQALVGTFDPLPAPRVNGGIANRTAVAAFALGIQLESSDLFPSNPQPRVVAYNGSNVNQVTVADYELPPGYPGGLKVTGVGSPAGRVEVYDWANHAWSAIDPGLAPALTAGERSTGIVRLRYSGSGFYNLQLSAAGS